MEGKTWVRD